MALAFDPLTALRRAGDLACWQETPVLVAARYKEAAPIAQRVRTLTKSLPAAPGYGYIFWHPERKLLHAVIGPADDPRQNQWHNRLQAINGVQDVTVSEERHPEDQEDWTLIKRAAALGGLNMPYQAGGKLTGGPSALSNAIVSGLLSGGLGYGTGWLLEHLFPERYVQRGRLRNTLAAAGLGLGAAQGAWQGSHAKTQLRDAGGDDSWRAALLTPTKDLPVKTAAPRRMQASTQAFLKLAQAAAFDAGGVGLRAVPMDAFNQAIWNDVRLGMTASKNPFGTKSPYADNREPLHTPPQLGALTSGLVTGLQEMYNGRSTLSPRHFVRGLATAGLDVATAHVLGGTLGALGGLTPEAQRKLQDIGLWGGLIRGTVGSLLGGS